ncbi:sushi, von Willebrand factor type A, EGF and pentraxin domain-containing protein 1-like [Oppia nitens]|uniref:sushi, von Willebrand factor type A, EGF and pentraxin domain-containing protein 1-like n=1 Tax=Oppia nitens TaxID=1686743 RepID=UPI0023DC049C|nr:sushi, von Willebrand factor type A, EGF and pentraxin domain-containing protein 1-like [Oppia nitens]
MTDTFVDNYRQLLATTITAAAVVATKTVTVVIVAVLMIAGGHRPVIATNESVGQQSGGGIGGGLNNNNNNHISSGFERNTQFLFCGEPPSVANAVSHLMRNQKHHVFKLDEIAVYSCDNGYRKQSGNDETKCVQIDDQQKPRWQPIDLICQPVKCTDPGNVDNSSRKVTGELRYNTNVNYECHQGFRMIGVPVLTCRANGTWNREKPKCQMKQCPELPDIDNGRLVYSDPMRRTDSKVEYVCNSNYKLMTISAIRYCRQDDSWSDLHDVNQTTSAAAPASAAAAAGGGAPICQMIRCESPVRPHSGLRILPSRPKSGSYRPGDVIIYSCDTSSKTKASSKCLSDGQWSRGPPHCPEKNSYCPSTLLGEFSAATDGYYNTTLKPVEGNGYKVGTRAMFYCTGSSSLANSPVLVCLPSGVWNGSLPKCSVDNTEAEALSGSSGHQLTVLITSIAGLAVMVAVITCIVVCRWRQQQLQRRRWQQYFGHYNHRQSKTNIMLNQNELKCFRQTPSKPTVPVTDL